MTRENFVEEKSSADSLIAWNELTLPESLMTGRTEAASIDETTTPMATGLASVNQD